MRYVAGMGFVNCDILYSGLPAIPEEGTELFSKGFEMKLGGGTPAVLINLARLGVPVSLSTFLGKDMFSEFVRKEIEQEGIEFQNLYTGTGRPVCVTSVMITPKDRTFTSHIDQVTISKEQEQRIYESFRNASLILMGPGMHDMYRKIKKENPETILVMDIGWDPKMSLKRCEESMRMADYFTPNSKEAMQLTGTDTPEDALEVLSGYFEKAIVKLGEKGCLLKENGKVTLIPPLPEIASADATGAGDAFMSGFFYGLYYHYNIKECIALGNVMGGKCVEKVGCLTARVTEKELLGEAKKICIQMDDMETSRLLK